MPAKLRENHGGVCTELSFDVDIETPEDEEHVREIVERLKQIPACGKMQRVPASAEA
jgi:hypothetical protein